MLIAFEGIDGCGKTTQIAMLRQYLESMGKTVFLTKYFSTQEVVNALGRFSLTDYADSYVGAFMIASEFLARLHYQIIPNLLQYDYVICDRYIYTAFARDQVRGVPSELLYLLYKEAIKPDITFFLEIEPIVSIQRKKKLDFFESGLDILISGSVNDNLRRYNNGEIDQALMKKTFIDFQNQILTNYYATNDFKHFIRIDATKSMEKQHEKIRGNVNEI